MAKPETIKSALGQRLRDIRAHLGDPAREDFCQRLGISKGSLANYERGDRVPDSDVIAAYVTALDVNANWIVAGRGAMFEKERPVKGKSATMLSGFEKLPQDLQDDLLAILRIDLKRAGLL
ncbi:transcriptional regulator with XRE-family HTH domain [Rhizobium aquaticum]|uniref:Transcriptional regulator with XRE-family HTH domain n=1 Tax=Rhizobium aquaticum TaxID=1549636 RepID=A0ABV2ITU8_9HYPH